MTRPIFWTLLVAIVAVNGAFDLWGAPVARRLAAKLAVQQRWPDSTYAPPDDVLYVAAAWLNAHVPLTAIVRRILAARYMLTLLPLCFLLYLGWTRRRIEDPDLAVAVSFGAFALVLKAAAWEAVWLLADAYTVF